MTTLAERLIHADLNTLARAVEIALAARDLVAVEALTRLEAGLNDRLDAVRVALASRTSLSERLAQVAT